MSGYRDCACRDCFEIAIGDPGAMCSGCEEAGCEPDSECQAEGAYGGEHGCAATRAACQPEGDHPNTTPCSCSCHNDEEK